MAKSALLGAFAATLVLAPLFMVSATVFGFAIWGPTWGGQAWLILPLVGAVAVGALVARHAWRIQSADAGD